MTPAQRAAYDRRAASNATRRAALAEDICWLRDTGEHPERAAQRLGLTPDALAKNIQRLGHMARRPHRTKETPCLT